MMFKPMVETTDMKQPPPLLPSPLVLPEELIVEILLKLPVRILLQFRCVCKSWKTLIYSPHFVRDHLHNSISDTSLTNQRLVSFTNDKSNETTTCSVQSLFENSSALPEILSFNAKSKNQYIVGSCYGLVCLYGDGYFRLWNPCTRLTSVRSPRLHLKGHIHSGFGYDQVNNKYKVLIYTRDFKTKVHTFGTNSWTTIRTFPCALMGLHGKFVSGTLNWLARKKDCIISFDLEKQTYDEVLLPLQLHDDLSRYPVLDALSNRLCLTYCDTIHYVVWLMEKYGIQESWTKLISIPCLKFQISESKLYFYLHPLCISENVVVMVRSNNLQLVMYNTNNGKLKFAKIKGKFRYDMHIYQSL